MFFRSSREQQHFESSVEMDLPDNDHSLDHLWNGIHLCCCRYPRRNFQIYQVITTCDIFESEKTITNRGVGICFKIRWVKPENRLIGVKKWEDNLYTLFGFMYLNIFCTCVDSLILFSLLLSLFILLYLSLEIFLSLKISLYLF